MILTIIIISIAVLFSLIVFRQSSEKKKYQDTVYQSNLKQITEFFNLIQTLSDYVTWIQRDQIKSKYSAAGDFFKNKANVYKKEETVKRFNYFFGDFDNYITQYNQNYVYTQKVKLKQYFDNIEGKK